TRMASLGVTANDVRAALAANNFTSAAGEVKSDFTQISVNALTSLDSAKAFGQLVIAAHGDALVRLGDVRSTFIPIVTIPLSLIGVMIALLALGYSINLLTLLALVLGIGLVVDD